MSTSPSTTNAKAESEILPRESDGGGLVYTWPPKVRAHQGERGFGEAGERANDVSITECGSPSGSARAGSPLPTIVTPMKNDDSTRVFDRSSQGSEEGALEKTTGLRRLRCKAPPPLRLDNDQAYDYTGEIGDMLLDRNGESTAREIQVSFPSSRSPLYIDSILVY